MEGQFVAVAVGSALDAALGLCIRIRLCRLRPRVLLKARSLFDSGDARRRASHRAGLLAGSESRPAQPGVVVRDVLACCSSLATACACCSFRHGTVAPNKLLVLARHRFPSWCDAHLLVLFVAERVSEGGSSQT
jgi:hypothetical protein